MNCIPAVALAGNLLLLGCAGSAQAAPASMRTLAKGAFSGIQESTEQVLTNQAAWEKVWNQHCSGKTSEKLPQVDFSKEMVVAVTMGRKTSGGYSIELKGVAPADGKLRIAVMRKTPPPGALTMQALTAPFCFAAVPKSDLKPEFVDTKPGHDKAALSP